MRSFWEPQPRVMPAFCGSPALGAMGGGLRGFSRPGRRSYKKAFMQTSPGRINKPWGPRPVRAVPHASALRAVFYSCRASAGAGPGPPTGGWWA
jgi:hypothetical protein